METILSNDLDPKIKFDVAAYPGGENIKLCYACGTCTAACPVAGIDEEFNPRKIIRQVLLGMRQQVLSSPLIWRCIQCYACYATCPQNVKFRDIILALRAMAVKEGHVDAGRFKDLQELRVLTVKIQLNLVNKLVTDKAVYAAHKKRVEELL
jgi:heterodisulfide reductase subunit C